MTREKIRKNTELPNTTKDFIIIVGKIDEERFRQFKAEYHQTILQSIKAVQNSSNIWAINSYRYYDLWSLMQRGDRVFFATNRSNFSHCGTIYKTLKNQDMAIKLWGDTPRIRQHDCLILFSSIEDVSRPFHETCRNAGIRLPVGSDCVYLAKNKVLAISASHDITGFVMENGDGGPAAKRSEVVTRFIRDTKKVKQLKKKYSNVCQVCGYTIQVTYKSKYSEVHHIHPLKDGGDDNFANMLVLCPTHHVEFDYKIIGIDSDGKTVLDRNGRKIGKIKLHQGHKIALKNINFHMGKMAHGQL